jgi:hypothetical protein
LSTCGWLLKPLAEATKPVTFTTRPIIVQAAGHGRSGGEGVEGAQPGSFLSLIEGYGIADLAGLDEATPLQWDLTGDED